MPGWYGGTNFMSPSFDAKRGLFFVTARETCMRYVRRPPSPNATLGDLTLGGTPALVSEPVKSSGALRALDAATGERKWEIPYADAGWAGVTATAGGVVFSADHQGTFIVADSATGKKLYEYQTGAADLRAADDVSGRRASVRRHAAGSTLTAFALPKANAGTR